MEIKLFKSFIVDDDGKIIPIKEVDLVQASSFLTYYKGFFKEEKLTKFIKMLKENGEFVEKWTMENGTIMTKYEDLEVEDMLDELAEAAGLEGSEVGEAWKALVDSEPAAKYGSSDFEAAWEREVQRQYRHLKENFRLVETEKTQVVKIKKLEFLE